MLASYFSENTAFTVDSDAPSMAGVLRYFPNFTAAGNEMVDARIHTGIHFRSADVDARDLGTAVARYVMTNAFLPLHGQKNGQLGK